jgi:DNA-binding NarL/FixJ family response regulator
MRSLRVAHTPKSATEPIRVVAVDDHEMFLNGVELLLEEDPEIQLVGSAATAREAIDACARLRADVVLLEVNLPEVSGIEVIAAILGTSPGTRVLIVSAFEDAVTIARALEAGAAGFVPKTHTADQLIEGIKQTMRGEVMLPTGYANAAISELRLESDARLKTNRLIQEFTTRELEVLRLLSKGMNIQEIGSALFVSQFTVRGHVRGILRKLHVHSMAQAIGPRVRARHRRGRASRGLHPHLDTCLSRTERKSWSLASQGG